MTADTIRDRIEQITNDFEMILEVKYKDIINLRTTGVEFDSTTIQDLKKLYGGVSEDDIS